MKRISVGLIALSLSACGASDFGVQNLGVLGNTEDIDFTATPVQVKCTFDPEAERAFGGPTVDTSANYGMAVPFGMQNNMVAPTAVQTNLGTQETPFFSIPGTAVTPVRMDIRWECDANGFTANLGPLVIPAFDPVLPFCLERRADTNSSFVGFDVVPAWGEAITGGEIGVSWSHPVSYQMGAAVDETFVIASLADQCCQDTAATNCDGNGTTPACTNLRNIFAALDPDGSDLQVGVMVGPSEDLIRFQPFSVYNGNYTCTRDPQSCLDSTNGAAYPMRARGVMEVITETGDLQATNEIVTTFKFCKNCGQSTGTSRVAFVDTDSICMYLLTP